MDRVFIEVKSVYGEFCFIALGEICHVRFITERDAVFITLRSGEIYHVRETLESIRNKLNQYVTIVK